MEICDGGGSSPLCSSSPCDKISRKRRASKTTTLHANSADNHNAKQTVNLLKGVLKSDKIGLFATVVKDLAEGNEYPLARTKLTSTG